MSLRKLCFSTMLATILAFAASGSFKRSVRKFDIPGTNASPNGPSLATDFPAQSEMPLPVFLPVQFKDPRDLAAGKLLVASRSLGDPHFTRTVVLLVQYDAQGVVGLILNRRTNVPLSRALDSVKAAKDRSDPIYVGGPVEPAAVLALFQSSAKKEGARQVFDGVQLITAKDLFEKTLSARPDPGVFHVYMGYAGWTRDQLRMEVDVGAWFIFPAEASSVFNSDPDSLWRDMIRKTEQQFAQSQPANADPWARTGRFADLSYQR